MASSVDRNRMFSERILWTPAICKATSKLSAHKAALVTKTDLVYFPDFSIRFVDFAAQFCFRCKFSFLEKPFESSLTVAWFFWINHNSLLPIATNEIASFCIDNRWRQMAFFVFAKVGKCRLSSNWERFWDKKLKLYVLYCIKQIDSMLPCVWSVTDNRGRQNVVRTSVTHSNISDTSSSCVLLLNRRTATWNLFLK